jgi:peptidoglycan/LPS O-acetylase OafA/YrhL
MAPETGRIRSLDGLRAVAILLVILAHLPHSIANAPAWSRHFMHLGTLGVRVFFVISGFLISTLLFAEFKKTGGISLRKFYFRRTLRIFPAFYTYIAVIALASVIGLVVLRPYDILAAVTYTTNYHRDRSWYLGHAWSLSVEEQFYLLWPFFIKRFGIRSALLAAFATVLLAPLVRVGTSVFFPEARLGIGETFFTVADAMATGCLLAGFRERLLAMPRYVSALASPWFWLVPLTVVAAHMIPFSLPSWLLGETIENVGIALSIHALIDVRQSAAVRFLNLGPVAFVGTLSYSLYLWQQPFLRARPDLIITQFPLNLLAVAVFALLSYYLVERPLLALRQRWEERARATQAARVGTVIGVASPEGGAGTSR